MNTRKEKRCLTRVLILSVLVICQAILMSACSGNEGKSEAEVIADVEKKLKETLTEADTIENVEIVDRNTDEDNMFDKVLCKVTTCDEETRFIKFYKVFYVLNEDNWIMTKLDESDSDKWEKLPLKGVEDSNVLTTLMGETILINEEVWDFSEGKVSINSIVSHETDLENKKDIITVEVIIDDIVEQAKGQVTIEYSYNNGWNAGNIVKTENFETSMKPTVDYNVTEDDLISKLEETGLVYGEYSFADKTYEQIIGISKEEISNFVIEKETTKNKGSMHEYICSFTLTKKHAVFNLQFNLLYTYSVENGWGVDITATKKDIQSVDVLGEWKGTFADGTATLSITEHTTDNTVKGTYSFKEINGNYGTYAVEGQLDLSLLKFTLIEGEWLGTYDAYSWSKVGLPITLFVEEGAMSGHWNSDVFTLYRATDGNE